jgi:glutathione synthase/RimK-type ligase-like ATP-grasp enzyme
MILVITEPGDLHAEPVFELLRRRGTEYVCFDSGKFPLNAQLSVDAKPSDEARLYLNGMELRAQDIQVAWFRKPSGFEKVEDYDEDVNLWLQEERRQFINGVFDHLPAFWVSNPAKIRGASQKLFQLQVAKQLGFELVPYLVTNEPSMAREFISSCARGTIVKCLGMPGLYRDGKPYSVYTHLITASDMELIESVAYAPTFLQEFVPKVADVRVTVIGRSVFAVRIDTAAHERAIVDFRRADIADLAHTPFSLPQELELACHALVAHLGLQFGAIDLLLTSSGKYVFLEINPNGQYLWIEELTGLPLTRTLVDLLTSRLTTAASAPAQVVEQKQPRTTVLPLNRRLVALPEVTHTTDVWLTGVRSVLREGVLHVTMGDVEVDSSR